VKLLSMKLSFFWVLGIVVGFEYFYALRSILAFGARAEGDR
jgi:hypothetical protein